MAFDLNEKYFSSTEEKLGVKLPRSYKQIMLKNNGGTIYIDEDNWELFPIEDKSDKKRIARTFNHIIYETNRAKEWATFPPDALTIASDGCGNFLIFKKKQNIYLNKIYLWNHEVGKIKQIAEDISELEIE